MAMNYTRTVLIGCLFSSFLSPAQAAPRDIGEGLRNNSISKALKNSEQQYSLWNGIGYLTTQDSACMATLIDTRNFEHKAVGPAYLITSGHCVTAEIGTSKLNQTFDASITFNYFYDTPDNHKTYKVRTANWTSMVGTDMALLEVDKPLALLIENGIVPLKLAPLPPLDRHDVLNVGAPGKFVEKGLRLSACTQEVSRTMSDSISRFPGGLTNQCADLHPGSSGSPMLDRRTNEIISITSEKGYSYAANFISDCFINGVFTNNSENCTLREVDITVELPSLFTTHAYSHWNSAGKEILPTWDYKFSINSPYYRYKTTRDAINCQDPSRYSAAISSTSPHINSAIGPQTRMHVLCIIGVESQEQKLSSGLLRNTFTHAVYLAEPAPVPNITLSSNRHINITWENSYPEYTTHFFHLGPADSTQCGNHDDPRYKTIAGSGVLYSFSPVKLCSYARRDTEPHLSAIRFDVITLPPIELNTTSTTNTAP
jgi:hypothetical protein